MDKYIVESTKAGLHILELMSVNRPYDKPTYVKRAFIEDRYFAHKVAEALNQAEASRAN